MLTKRANILFDVGMWNMLVKQAKAQNMSVGNLVREAVKRQYLTEKQLQDRRKAIDHIFKIRPKFKGRLDYKEMINYGRKY